MASKVLMPHLLQKNADLTKARQRLRNSEISTGQYRKLTRDAGRQFDLRCAWTTLNHPQPPVRPPPTHSPIRRARRMRRCGNDPRGQRGGQRDGRGAPSAHRELGRVVDQAGAVRADERDIARQLYAPAAPDGDADRRVAGRAG